MRPKQLLLIGAAICAAYGLTPASIAEGSGNLIILAQQQGGGGGQQGGQGGQGGRGKGKGQGQGQGQGQQGGQGGGGGQQRQQQQQQQRQQQQQQQQQNRQQQRQQQQQQQQQNRQQQQQQRQQQQQQQQQNRQQQQQQQQQQRQQQQQQQQQNRQQQQQQQQLQRQQQQIQQQQKQLQNQQQQQRQQQQQQIQNQQQQLRQQQQIQNQQQQLRQQQQQIQNQQQQFRRQRQQFQTFQPQYQQRGNRNYYNVGNTRYIQNNAQNRFRRYDPNAQVLQFGSNFRTVTVSPTGGRVVTITDPSGRLIRRSHFVNGREYIMIDNRFRGPRRPEEFYVALPPPVIRIPQNRYIVDAGVAPPDYVYGALMAAPVGALQRQYTLDEIRFSPDVRNLMPRVDIDTITFASGSSEITPDQFGRLAPIADGIKRAVSQNPSEVFLIEGHTDAVGETDENLALSDRRAEAVADVLTNQFRIPPENLTTQGYGEQQLKIPTQGPERVNRRVTVRRITPLLQQGQAQEADQQPDDQDPQDQQQQPQQQQFAPQQQPQFAPQQQRPRL